MSIFHFNHSVIDFRMNINDSMATLNRNANVYMWTLCDRTMCDMTLQNPIRNPFDMFWTTVTDFYFAFSKLEVFSPCTYVRKISFFTAKWCFLFYLLLWPSRFHFYFKHSQMPKYTFNVRLKREANEELHILELFKCTGTRRTIQNVFDSLFFLVLSDYFEITCYF